MDILRNKEYEKKRILSVKREFGARSIFEHAVVIAIITIVCCAVDFYTIKSEWTLLRADDILFIYGKSLVNAFGLDVSLSILAVAQRRHECNMLGTASFKQIAIMSLSVFGMALIMELYLAYLTGKYTFALSTGTSSIMVDGQMVSSGSDANLSSGEIAVVSLINGLTPALTSLVVYVTTYLGYDPIREEFRRLRLEIVRNEHGMINQKKVLTEIGKVIDLFRVHAEHEKSKFETHMRALDCLEVLRKQISYLEAMKRLDADGVSELKEYGKQLNSVLDQMEGELKDSAEALISTIKGCVEGYEQAGSEDNREQIDTKQASAKKSSEQFVPSIA